ncbi:MAG: hypothetical protein ACE5J7_01310, partial [Candidatus Aenigmatarchaeota archaeon]
DTYMMSSPERIEMVKEYYARAPAIVHSISLLPNRKQIYRTMRTRYIAPAVRAIKQGKFELALELYKQGIRFARSFLS